MKQELLYIDSGGCLYRGFGRCYPIIVWKEGHWAAHPDFGVPPDDWGQLVSEAEAERCYPGSTGAALPAGIPLVRDLSAEEAIRYRPELFDSYDGPITRRSPEEIKRYATTVIALHVKELLAKRGKKRKS